ncbi:nickel import ATP-binding protein NikE [Mycolicibacterium hassiacum DSM 44199]|uniref:Nickel import ATP-binding protein NikE n=1 Tax=Mycolicibacterium hassiacum (strain DSM 44199 / CIP 105218 / JCM 12690 / 3849) TaxID=1122247 RepID=K5BFH7_MYCHD|nr:ABC transporter ATP-binding protein [Mycolicibacterium hassiacum]EKF23161.1 nickel import ATP-binding protein NikE [Mycolicibacterium hassiacum DSM 44199]MDA4085590.1 ABC transporter ATP-binding protein [Mycolicibacterium hassiacum DSM 44199]VCT89626.1 Glutathione import ATP-binding protein GsiA [Mycolicibacterium hassiacum DSM 44199]
MGEPLLEVTDLEVTLGGRRVVESVRFAVEPGRTLAIVGESGSGKSVSLLAATRLLGGRAQVRGRVRFRGRDLLAAADREVRQLLGRDIGFVFQDPQSNLHPFKTIGRQIDEALRVHGVRGRAARRERVHELLDEVGIADPEHAYRHYPAEFSGGMRQRVMIAMAIACSPALLIADEPTTALDASVQADILALLARLQRDHDMAMVFVSHDLAVVHQIADTVTVVRSGRVVESGPVQQIYRRPESAYTRRLLAASRLHSLADAGEARPALRPAAAEPEPVLTVRGLRKSYRARGRRRRVVIDGLDLSVRRGEIVGLVGESGSGKSTVGRIVAGLAYADAGEITLAGTRYPTAVSDGVPPLPAAARRAVQLVFQDPYASLNPRRRVGDSIAEPLRIQRVPEPDIAERVRTAAARAALPAELLGRFPAELSGGQRQRVAIARALVLEPEVIVADEALSSLDVTTQAEIVELFAGLAREQGTGLLFISHDLGVVAAIADRVVVLGPDGVAESGRTAEVFADPRSPYTRRLLAAVPRIEARAS